MPRVVLRHRPLPPPVVHRGAPAGVPRWCSQAPSPLRATALLLTCACVCVRAGVHVWGPCVGAMCGGRVSGAACLVWGAGCGVRGAECGSVGPFSQACGTGKLP